LNRSRFDHWLRRETSGANFVNPQRLLIVLGVTLLIAGLAWPLIAKLGLGRLPGDIVLRRGGFTLYAPIVTCLILSAVLTLIAWLMRR
jgi:hypothetical protein